MRNLKSLKKVAAVLIAFAMFAAPALAAGQDLTVGKFLMEIAKIKNLSAADAVTARDSLARAGINVGNLSLDKGLTQGDVVVISTAAGLPMSTSTPEAAFNSEQMTTFLNTFGPELGGGDDNTTQGTKPKVDPRDKGNGLKKGLYKRSPSEPI